MNKETGQASICNKCDQCGGEKTYANQVCMPLNGKVRCIDWCIHQIVASLNAGGVETVACCCGHGKEDGNIVLADGRELMIIANGERARRIEHLIKENNIFMLCE